ncbi:signal peptidase I [Flexivirga alba]|uniref:Signal peptidase I n=1 Tax=Flexivirga alba TaxID=702742 RepID=A0ABW2AFT3_9MICO
MATPITHRQQWRTGRFALLIAVSCRGLLAMLVSLLVWSVLPVALGWHVTVVMSGSMEPALRPGDVVASRPVSVQQVRPGQVLLVDDPDHAGRLRLHRLVRINPDGTLTLRGDANPAADSTPVRRSAVRGVGSLRVPLVGSPAYWAQTHRSGQLVEGAAALVLLLAGACAWRDEEDDSDGDSRDDTGDGSGIEAHPDAPTAGNAPPAEVPEDESSIRRAAFAGRGARLAGIGVLTFGLIGAGIATGPAALAAPLTANTSSSSTWAAATSFAGCSPAVMTDKPYAYYRLAETSGTTAADASGNGRNGTYSSGVTHNAGGPCSDASAAATFTGSEMVSTTQQIALGSTFTEEIWFNTTAPKGGSLIGFANTPTGSASDPQLSVNSASRLVFAVPTSSGSVTVTSPGPKKYNDGAWHLVVATLSSAGMQLYVDGVSVASNSSTTTMTSTTGYLQMGNGFPGSLSGAAFYNTALSAAQITAHYNAT